MKCPICKEEMLKKLDGDYSIFECEGCDKVFASLSSMKNSGKDVDILTEIRNDTMEHGLPSNICPSCSRQMKAKPAKSLQNEPLIEYCAICNFVFLPKQSYHTLPEREMIDEYDNMSDESLKVLQDVTDDLKKKLHVNSYESIKDYSPVERILLYFFPRLLGAPKLTRIPIVTSFLLGIALIFSFIPRSIMWSSFQEPLLSFQHIVFDFSISQSIIGLYVLFLFGSRLEVTLGRKSYLIFLASTYFVSYILRLFINPQSVVTGGMFLTMAITAFFMYLFYHSHLRGAFFLRIYTIPVWMFTFLMIIFTLLIQSSIGFEVGNILFLIVSFGMPIIFLIALGGRKTILKKAGFEEYTYFN